MSSCSPEGTIQTLFYALNEGDLKTIMTLYLPEAVLVARPGQEAIGLSAIQSAMKAFLDMKPVLTWESINAVVSSDLALVFVKWSLTGVETNGRPVHMQGLSSDVLQKQFDGRWLFVIDNPWGSSILR